MSTTEQGRPDTQEMVIVHRVFRREFRLLPDLVAAVPGGNTTRAAVLAEHCIDMVTGLHHHHAAEDEFLWPPLLRQAKPHAEVVHRMETQHHDMSTALKQVEALLPEWAAHARVAERDELVDALRKVQRILDEHLAEEEKEILPLVEQFLTMEQWAAVGERGKEAISDKRKRLLFLGMILEDATPAEEAHFLSRMPPPVRLLWRLVGRRQYAAHLSNIRTL